MHAKVAPKTNISKASYKHIVSDIEHDPLVKHSTLSAACLFAVIAILLGCLLWFAKSNPGDLIQSKGTITNISSGKTDSIGTITTFISFSFTTKDGKDISVRQVADDGLSYSEGQQIRIGYHPKNPNYARNLADNRPPQASIFLWSVPFILMIWFIFVALFRHNTRQHLIWAAAEAADADD